MTAALVAGGATGIGRATVRALRADGNDVYIADIDAETAAAVADEKSSGRGTAGHHDLADPEAPRAAVAAALAAFGRLDSVVVTAALHVVAPLEDYAVADWDKTMAVNVRAPYLFAQAAAPALAQNGGSLLFTGSTAAFRGSGGTFAYAASKGALISLTRSLGVELAPRGIRVNCVCPGWIDTRFNDPFWQMQTDAGATQAEIISSIPLGRQGQPPEVAALITYLLSADARYITGQSIIVDGGLLSA